MPIVDLMAISNTHFQKLKDFITCSFPAGFPVKIEIPLFHVLNARVTFGNIFALGNGVSGIQGECILVIGKSFRPCHELYLAFTF